MSRITLAREYPDDRDVIAQICKLKSRTSATEKETSQIEQHLNETDRRVSDLVTITQGFTPEDIETVKTVADDVQQLESEVTALDGRVDTLETERVSDRQYIEAVADDLVQNYATKNALQGVSTSASQTQTQLTNLATEIQTTHPYVTTNTAQNITAVKKVLMPDAKMTFQSSTLERGVTPPTNQNIGEINFKDKNELDAADIIYRKFTNGHSRLIIKSTGQSGDDAELCINHNADGTHYASVTTPYDGSPSNSIVNKEWVQATDGRSNIVHNNQANTFSQQQKFNANATLFSNNIMWHFRSGNNEYWLMDDVNTVANVKLRLVLQVNDDGTCSIRVEKYNASPETFISSQTLATL